MLLQVLSRKDQAQYWYHKEQPYNYVSIEQFVNKFKESHIGLKLDEELAKPFIKSRRHKNAVSFEKFSLTKWELLKACANREFLLMKRNSFTYIFKSTQVPYRVKIIPYYYYQWIHLYVPSNLEAILHLCLHS